MFLLFLLAWMNSRKESLPRGIMLLDTCYNVVNISTQFNCQKHFSFKIFSLVKQFLFKKFSQS